MIDFSNASYMKLTNVPISKVEGAVNDLIIENEEIISAYKGMRDFVVFTTKRAIAVNVQGITGKKIDYTSLPYSKIVAYSVETAGTFDLDAELDLWFSGLGKVRFEFRGSVDIKQINRTISEYVL
ncbi:MAG: PH domain-containing protein [Erysipelothrix sp.]|nr:PH domain-containing protein [Erysipelothrix sp.]